MPTVKSHQRRERLATKRNICRGLGPLHRRLLSAVMAIHQLMMQMNRMLRLTLLSRGPLELLLSSQMKLRHQYPQEKAGKGGES